MQDKILLGFLLEGEKTGYEVKKLMETSTNFFFNTSLGSIYPAFRKLEGKGLVKLQQRIDGGRVKNIYNITAEGRNVFFEWMKKRISISKVKEESLLKIFFFSTLPEEDRCRQISGYIEQLEDQVEALAALKENLAGIGIDPFMLRTLDFGIEHYLFLKKWHQRFLSEMRCEET